MEGYIYLIETKDKKHRYIGASFDVHKRLIEHNKGTTKSTKYKKPWTIIQCWKIPTLEEAKRIEFIIKKMKKKLTCEYISYKINKELS